MLIVFLKYVIIIIIRLNGFSEVMALKLSDRMEKILNMCGKRDAWADIGCDHGRISCELILRGKAERVIAADISELSLYKAKDLSSSLGLRDKVDCRQGDGLKVLRAGETQGAVLAGMGTPLIEKIISDSMAVADSLSEMVLSANNYPDRLRRWLAANGFNIIHEAVAEDSDKFYPIIKVEKSDVYSISKREAYLGRNVIQDDTYYKYISSLIAREEKIIKSIAGGGADASEHEELKKLYEEVKHGN